MTLTMLNRTLVTAKQKVVLSVSQLSCWSRFFTLSPAMGPPSRSVGMKESWSATSDMGGERLSDMTSSPHLQPLIDSIQRELNREAATHPDSPESLYRPSPGQLLDHVHHRIARVAAAATAEYCTELSTNADMRIAVLRDALVEFHTFVVSYLDSNPAPLPNYLSGWTGDRLASLLSDLA